MKTERRSYVTCLNCREDTAGAQFMETKRFYGKLAQELWGDRFEVVVATHCNTGPYHNHFVINSVSWADDKSQQSVAYPVSTLQSARASSVTVTLWQKP